MQSVKKLLAVVLFSLNSLTVHASLVDLESVRPYNSVQNIIWLQDARYDLIRGYTANSQIISADENMWVGASDYHDKPSKDLSVQTPFSRHGDPDYAYNMTSPLAVLTYLYNDQYPQNVDSNALCHSSRKFAYPGDNTFKCQQNLDFMSWLRGLGAELAANPVPAALLGVIIGFEASDDNSGEFPARVIIPDDVANMPLPHAFWLFGGGIGGWLGLRRCANKTRRNQTIHRIRKSTTC